MEIFKIYKFDAAHSLPNVGREHKCSDVHGHSFCVVIHIKGAVDPRFGWVMDFAEIDKSFQPLLNQLDHKYLNEVECLDNPTSENIAKWIWQRLRPILPQLNKVVVQESEESGCIYHGEESSQ